MTKVIVISCEDTLETNIVGVMEYIEGETKDKRLERIKSRLREHIEEVWEGKREMDDEFDEWRTKDKKTGKVDYSHMYFYDVKEMWK